MTLLLSTLVCGVGCMLLRLVMMVVGCDETGMLRPGQMVVTLGWILTGLYLAGLAWGVQALGGDRASYVRLFPASGLCGGMGVLAGAVLVLHSLTQTGILPVAAGVLAGGCMVFTGVCRIMGRRPAYGFTFVVCVYFIYRLISGYRGWSIDPQLQDYAYQILACVALMLAAYYRAAADGGIIRRRMLAFTCLAACFFCIVCLSDPEIPVYYGACGLWALSGTGYLDPVRGS